jgi:hypothetical protein
MNNVIEIKKTVDIGRATVREIRIDLATNVAEFHYRLAGEGGAETREVLTQDLAQWPKYEALVADLLGKAEDDIGQEARKKLKNKEK